MIDHGVEAIAAIDEALLAFLPYEAEPTTGLLFTRCLRCAAPSEIGRSMCRPCHQWAACLSDDDPLEGRSLNNHLWETVAQGLLTLPNALRMADAIARQTRPDIWPPLDNG